MTAIRRGSLGGFLASLETLGGLIGQWAGSTFIELPGDPMSATADRLASLGAGEVAAAAKRWFDPDRVAIVAAGPARVLALELARFGPVQVVSAAPPPPTAARHDTLSATPENLAKGRQLAEQAIQAHGGLDAFRAIHDSVIEEKIAMDGPGMNTTGSIRQLRKDPDRFLSVTQYKEYEARQVLNGSHGWIMTGNQLVDADSLQIVSLRASYLSDLPHLLLALEDRGVQLIASGPDRIEQRDVEGVEVRLLEGQRRRYYFDAVTHLLAAIDFFQIAADGEEHRSRRLYGSYQTVDHVRWPFREQRLLDNRMAMRIEITDVKTNFGVTDRDFEKPAMRRP